MEPWRDPLLTELRGQAVLGGGYALALNFLARSGLSRKRKNRMMFSPYELGVRCQVSGLRSQENLTPQGPQDLTPKHLTTDI